VNNNSDFHPDWVSPPGDTILDLLEENVLSVREFADLMGFTMGEAADLIQGQTVITAEIAQKLSEVLGGSAEFWRNRDLEYRKGRTHGQD